MPPDTIFDAITASFAQPPEWREGIRSFPNAFRYRCTEGRWGIAKGALPRGQVVGFVNFDPVRHVRMLAPVLPLGKAEAQSLHRR